MYCYPMLSLLRSRIQPSKPIPPSIISHTVGSGTATTFKVPDTPVVAFGAKSAENNNLKLRAACAVKV
jgi:hypothetical protein